jgi:transposase
MKNRELTIEERAEIAMLRSCGKTLKEIATTYNVHFTTVAAIAKKKQITGTVANRPRSGRPTLFKERDQRALKRTLLSNRRAPLAEIKNCMPTQISITTLRKEIHKLDFWNRVAPKKPFLSQKHKADRLRFALAHEHWTVEDWSRVIWTDESSFEIGKNSRQVRVWRRVHEKHDQDCLAPTFKSGRTSVMVWGAFTATSKSNLILMPVGKRTAADFVDLVYDKELETYYFSHRDQAAPILMEDGAPIHRAATSRLWREQRGMEKLQWPAQSPDLNPIENLWMHGKDEVQNKVRPNNKEEMWQAVKQAWDAVSQERIAKLVRSMPDRIRAVIKAEGGSTRW